MAWFDFDELKEKIGQAVLDGFAKLTPDLNGIDSEARGYSRGAWQTMQTAAVAGSGAVTVLLPGFHLLTLVADVGFLINRMSVCAYGLGALAAEKKGMGFVLEQEDLAAILARWSGDTSVSDAALSKMAASGAAMCAGTALGVKFAEMAVKHAGLLIGKKLGGKVGAKVASKFVGKYIGKVTSGFIPFVGPAICAGINTWFITEMCMAASSWYTTKLRWAEGGLGEAGLAPA
jgi:hypothetical protein